MARHKDFIILVVIINLMWIILNVYISEAGMQQENLELAQAKHYRRIFPESVSPKPDEIQTRDAREKMKADVKKEKQLLEEQQKELISLEEEPAEEKPSEEKPIVFGKEPIRIYYRISVNDRLYIAVWRVPDLSLEFVVGPDGYISFPLIGDIRAAGKTLSELNAEITEKLKEYVEDPQVSVMIREFAGDQVTVIGEVRGPGIYKFVGKTKIMDVIALAGGFTDRAKSASIVIVREPPDPKKDDTLIVVKIKSILKGNTMNNIEVKPYDIVYVSRTFVSNVKQFYDDWIVPTVDQFLDYESYKSIRRSRHR